MTFWHLTFDLDFTWLWACVSFPFQINFYIARYLSDVMSQKMGTGLAVVVLMFIPLVKGEYITHRFST